ncbi:MAG TPA: endonuclease VIII [Bacteroidales bacterium]|nr:endonuclease VIII [Bacteroidales bacterium]HNR42245.1 endonuclease VIII [Bacteroidales bacterium]HPM17548.1 endonuclease VIII [Bacteroidales bacterium]
MLEIPESKTISLQAGKILSGRRITDVFSPTSHHKFAWFSGDPAEYARLLSGKTVKSTFGHGMFVDILCDGESCITIGEGTIMRYHAPSEEPPGKYQLLITFDDNSHVAFNVAMYGGIWAYRGIFENRYHQLSLNSISPLDDAFDEDYFDVILNDSPENISVKALLATEQRFPGLGNGVLQDILFNAGIHPKRKKSSLSGRDKADLFISVRDTLKIMTEKGGRDTEKDFFGNEGGYKTILSRNTFQHPCRVCGDQIRKEAYLGGAVYFCLTCQRL